MRKSNHNNRLHVATIPLRLCVMKRGVSLSCCIEDESRPLDFGDQKLNVYSVKCEKENLDKTGLRFTI